MGKRGRPALLEPTIVVNTKLSLHPIRDADLIKAFEEAREGGISYSTLIKRSMRNGLGDVIAVKGDSLSGDDEESLLNALDELF